MSTETRVNTDGGAGEAGEGGGHVYTSRGNGAPCTRCQQETPDSFQDQVTDVQHPGSRPECGEG